MSTGALGGDLTTPRDVDYWEPLYRELALLPDWGALDEGARARRLLDRIEAECHGPDAPEQIKALLCCSPEEQLRTVRGMLRHFGRQGA